MREDACKHSVIADGLRRAAGGGCEAHWSVNPTAVVHNMTFDSVRTVGFLDRLAADRVAVVAGCEAHVCVLQAVLSLMTAGAKAPTACKQLRNA
jgi:hypothetical protein